MDLWEEGDEELIGRSWDELALDSLRAALDDLADRFGPDPEGWRWGRVHRLDFPHALGEANPLFDRIFNRSLEAGGAQETVSQIAFDPNDPFKAVWAPSWRMVVDMADPGPLALAGRSPASPASPAAPTTTTSRTRWLDGRDAADGRRGPVARRSTLEPHEPPRPDQAHRRRAARAARAERVVTVATIGPRGWPHLMPLWYVLRDGEIWVWTYAKSQKVRTSSATRRATLLIETGHEYAELRGMHDRGRGRARSASTTVVFEFAQAADASATRTGIDSIEGDAAAGARRPRRASASRSASSPAPHRHLGPPQARRHLLSRSG